MHGASRNRHPTSLRVANLDIRCLISPLTGVRAGASPARSSALGPAATLSLSLNPPAIVCGARNEPTQRRTKPGSRQPTAPLTPNRPLSSPCALVHVCAIRQNAPIQVYSSASRDVMSACQTLSNLKVCTPMLAYVCVHMCVFVCALVLKAHENTQDTVRMLQKLHFFAHTPPWRRHC